MGPTDILVRLHKRIVKIYKSSGSFTLGKILNLLFDARRRPPVDVYEKFLDFLADFGPVKKVVDKNKKNISCGRSINLLTFYLF
jgi:hypothetical protein